MEGWTETMGTQRCASASGRVTRAAPEAGASNVQSPGTGLQCWPLHWGLVPPPQSEQMISALPPSGQREQVRGCFGNQRGCCVAEDVSLLLRPSVGLAPSSCQAEWPSCGAHTLPVSAHLQAPSKPALSQFRPEASKSKRERERGREESSHSNFIEQENSYAIYENRKREGGVLSLHVEKCSSVIQKNEVFDCCQAQVSFLS